MRDVAKPRETLLVVDGLTGQDAVQVAKSSTKDRRLWRCSDAYGWRRRGGAALSMRAVTGTADQVRRLGEKMDALETLSPSASRAASLAWATSLRWLRKAQETIEAEQAETMMKRFQKGQFNMNDLKASLSKCRKWAAWKASWA